MAKKTPDYTKQARQTRQRERQTVAPVTRTMAYMVYASLIGAVGLFIFGLYLVVQTISSRGDDRAVTIAALGMGAGIVCNILVLLLCRHVFDRKKHPLAGISKKYLMWGIVLSGMVCVMVVMSSKFWQTLMGPGLIPPIAIMVFVLRPRLKALAIAEGRYAPSRSEKARDDWDRERAERRAEKERYEALKASRLNKPAAAAAGSSKSSGGGRKQDKAASSRKGSKSR